MPGRAGILIHVANWGGNREKGYICDLLGCIGPGRMVGRLKGQKAVVSSRPALRALLRLEVTKLFVEWGFPVDDAALYGPGD